MVPKAEKKPKAGKKLPEEGALAGDKKKKGGLEKERPSPPYILWCKEQ